MQSVLDTTQLIALVTGAISLVGIIIVQYIGVRENRIARYTNIITKHTLEMNVFIRENSEILTLMTRPEIIDEYRNKGESYEFKKALLRAEINIEHHFYHGLSQELELINIIREITSRAFMYYENPSQELKTILMELGEKYYNMMTVFDYSDWQYIKSQAKTKAYNVQYENFDLIYQNEQNKLKNAGTLKSWMDL